MQAKRAGRNPHDVQNAVERLRQHFLNLAADEARRREVQVREREHVALDAPPLFFVNGHHHQHAGKKLRQPSSGSRSSPCQKDRGAAERPIATQIRTPADESDRQQACPREIPACGPPARRCVRPGRTEARPTRGRPGESTSRVRKQAPQTASPAAAARSPRKCTLSRAYSRRQHKKPSAATPEAIR